MRSVNAKRADEKPLVTCCKVTAYTAAEKVAAKLDKAVPFMLEAELRNRGANFIAGEWKAGHVEGDANLITGQNPQSTASVAKEIAMALGEDARLRKSQTSGAFSRLLQTRREILPQRT